jgi:hypothetical protein
MSEVGEDYAVTMVEPVAYCPEAVGSVGTL